MPRRASPPPPKGPTLTTDEARSQLEDALAKGRALAKQNPITEERYDVWSQNAWVVLTAAFGEHSGHRTNFRGPLKVVVDHVPEHYAEAERRQNLERRIRVLEAIIEGLPTTPQPRTPVSENFWSRIHPSVLQVSRSRFETGHYADAVEAAFKELNQKFKELVRRKTGQEPDGAGLMTTAFSPKNSIIALADLSTDDGRNMQQGYMLIFAGAMTGIRNPKAHSNVDIDEKRAVHHLHLASLLHYVFDERL